jgi:hypothetical protein
VVGSGGHGNRRWLWIELIIIVVVVVVVLLGHLQFLPYSPPNKKDAARGQVLVLVLTGVCARPSRLSWVEPTPHPAECWP